MPINLAIEQRPQSLIRNNPSTQRAVRRWRRYSVRPSADTAEDPAPICIQSITHAIVDIPLELYRTGPESRRSIDGPILLDSRGR
jgi:hypothetical protein